MYNCTCTRVCPLIHILPKFPSPFLPLSPLPLSPVLFPPSSLPLLFLPLSYGLDTQYQQVSEVGSIQNSFSESGEGIIDGRVDVGTFVSIDPPYGSDGMSATEELEKCQKTVLKPYLTFLKVVM